MSKPQFELGKHYDESFKGLSPRELTDNMESLAYGKEDAIYTKKLTKEELDVAKSKLADVSIAIAKIQEDKKEAMDEFKEMLKDPNISHKELIEMIKFKAVSVSGILYEVDDQEAGLMYKFDTNAICVDVRALLPTERQTRIRKMSAEQ